jgi:hypothetical protein
VPAGSDCLQRPTEHATCAGGEASWQITADGQPLLDPASVFAVKFTGGASVGQSAASVLVRWSLDTLVVPVGVELEDTEGGRLAMLHDDPMVETNSGNYTFRAVPEA